MIKCTNVCKSIQYRGEFAGKTFIWVTPSVSGFSVQEIADDIQFLLTTPYNENGTFLHPVSFHETHLCFFGDEPMQHQAVIRDLLTELSGRGNIPRYVLVETGGMAPMEDETHDLIVAFYMTSEFDGLVPDNRGRPEWCWEIIPALKVSNDDRKTTLKNLLGYNTINEMGYLSWKADGDDIIWYEINNFLDQLREVHLTWPVYISANEVSGGITESEIRDQIMERGFYFSA